MAGGYGGIFVLLTPTGAMLVARGVSQSGRTALRRRIPHLGVRAGKSHLINGLIGDDNLRLGQGGKAIEIVALFAQHF